MDCPRDKIEMQNKDGVSSCSSCSGSFLEKKHLGPDFYRMVKDKFRLASGRVRLSCPACGTQMKLIEYKDGVLQLDLCLSCKGVWFDESEARALENIIEKKIEAGPLYIDPKDMQSYNRAKTAYNKYQGYRADKKHKASVAEALFQIITSLPIEKNMASINKPVITYSIVFITTLIFLVTAYLLDLNGVFSEWAYIPGAKPFFPYSFYSMFLHVGFFHILGNMYFLFILGDNVEDVMGKKWFLALYFTAGVVGFLASAKAGPLMIPHVGASGGIAGVMAAYFFLFPKAKFVVRFFIVVVFPLSSLTYFGFWFGYQLIMYFISKNSGVSWAAHVAGFCVGMLFVIIFNKKYQIESIDTD